VRFEFFGGFLPGYPRGAVLRKGLGRIGAEVVECRFGAGLKSWARHPLLLLDAFRRGLLRPEGAAAGRCLFVPEFCAKDVPPARLLASLTARPLIFDPLAARYETKVIDWGWGRPDSPGAWWNFQIDRASFALADLVLADTTAHKRYYCETYGLSPAKVEVVPLGYDDDVFRPPAETELLSRALRPGNGFQVLFFGSFLPLHGVEIIVEAARLVWLRDRSIRFRLIGEGRTSAATRAAAADLANIDFSGRVPMTELARAAAAADVCLGIFGRTAKTRRVVPHKIFQAMGLARPVVTLRTPAVEEFFAHDKNIVLCDKPDPEALARAVLELARDPGRRERIARAGFSLVRREFTPEAVARRLAGFAADHFGPAFALSPPAPGGGR